MGTHEPSSLRVGTYLGANAVSAVEDLARLIGGALEMNIVNISTSTAVSADGLRDGHTLDIMWACGLITAGMLRRDNLAASVVAAPVFAKHRGPSYTSVVVVPNASPVPQPARIGINEVASWSGHHALATHIARTNPWPDAEVVITGSHEATVRALVTGDIDVGAIDSSLWPTLHDAVLGARGLAVFAETEPYPSPPICIANAVAPAIRAAITSLLLAVSPGQVRGVDGFAPAESADYWPMLDLAAKHDLTSG